MPDFFDYYLPPGLIAQHPSERRDQARLLVVRRHDRTLAHHTFADLPQLLAPGDLLILNDTRVVPARLLGKRSRTAGKWEGLFLRALPGGVWELMCQTRGRLVAGESIELDSGLRLRLREKTAEGHWLAEPEQGGDALQLLERHGHTPLPPYIRKGRAETDDRERYQTVFARQAGAVAAPTAGLHFTPDVFARLAERGIAHAFVTLHVGLGTFQPVQADDYRTHQMHREWGSLPQTTADAIAACKARGGRVVAVGTTAVRVLETVAKVAGTLRVPSLHAWSGETDLYIYPPYTFRVVDNLITNFHLPRSTLLLLVGAFAGVELLRHAYMTAIDSAYRFFSYGDAMLIL
jgi:S-adenosylmethionine:tRNA ribosyltransferase-isomerase